jgi:hypothetical protein
MLDVALALHAAADAAHGHAAQTTPSRQFPEDADDTLRPAGA